MCLYIHLYIGIFISTFVHPTLCLSVHSCIHTYINTFVCLSKCFSFHLSVQYPVLLTFFILHCWGDHFLAAFHHCIVYQVLRIYFYGLGIHFTCGLTDMPYEVYSHIKFRSAACSGLALEGLMIPPPREYHLSLSSEVLLSLL